MIDSSDCPRIERSFLKICLFISASSETSQVIADSTPFFRISKNPGATSEFKFKSNSQILPEVSARDKCSPSLPKPRGQFNIIKVKSVIIGRWHLVESLLFCHFL